MGMSIFAAFECVRTGRNNIILAKSFQYRMSNLPAPLSHPPKRLLELIVRLKLSWQKALPALVPMPRSLVLTLRAGGGDPIPRARCGLRNDGCPQPPADSESPSWIDRGAADPQTEIHAACHHRKPQTG